MSLTLDEIAALQALGCDAYRQRVVGLFLSHRATPAHYAAIIPRHHEIMPGCPTACGGEEWHPC